MSDLTTHKSDRRGFALPAAIGTLVIVALLVTAGFFVAQQELRMGVASRHSSLAFNIAEAGATNVMANWNGYQLGQIPAWEAITITEPFGSMGEWEVTIHNTNNSVYFLSATGRVTNAGIWSGATRTIGIATKIIFANIDPPGALTTQGDVDVFGNTTVDGTNVDANDPSTWSSATCNGFGTDPMPGVVTPSGAGVTTTGNGEILGDPLLGDPAHLEDDAVTDASFTDFGNLTWGELTAIAIAEGVDVTPSALGTVLGPTDPEPLDVNGECTEGADPLNWGDITEGNPCSNYFPLIYSGRTETRIAANSTGQGVLLVEGDLILNGNFTFYGIIIVQGSFSTAGNDNTVIGAVMARSGAAVEQDIAGNSSISFSDCAVRRAILNNSALSRVRPIAERSWVDLTAVAN